jgi:hypothetical protein
MSDLPELIVDEDAVMPDRNLTHDDPHTVRVEGSLPTVCGCACHRVLPAPIADADCACEKYQRPLRAGDRVTLSTIDRVPYSPGGYEVPFATATVAKIGREITTDSISEPTSMYWLVKVTAVKALP